MEFLFGEIDSFTSIEMIENKIDKKAKAVIPWAVAQYQIVLIVQCLPLYWITDN